MRRHPSIPELWGLPLLCVPLLLGCRVRSTHVSAEALSQATEVASAPVETAEPEVEDEEVFWPSLALRPVTRPPAARESSEPPILPPATTAATDSLMTALVPELPALVWVPGFVEADSVQSGERLDAAAVHLAHAIRDRGRVALLPALEGMAHSRWPHAGGTGGAFVSVQSSLGQQTQVRLRNAQALLKATSVWGAGPSPAPGETDDVDDVLVLTETSISGPAVLLIRIPEAPAEVRQQGELVPAQGGFEYVAIVMWGAMDSGHAVGPSPAWQVTGEHGTVVAFAATSGPHTTSPHTTSHPAAAAAAAYAALQDKGPRAAAELGLFTMRKYQGGAPRAVAVLGKDDAWVASTLPSLEVGMSAQLRQRAGKVSETTPAVVATTRDPVKRLDTNSANRWPTNVAKRSTAHGAETPSDSGVANPSNRASGVSQAAASTSGHLVPASKSLRVPARIDAGNL